MHARFRHPSLTAVRAFEAAARHGSFTRAAEELHLTQSAVSRHVRTLESWFSLPLFARKGRSVQLTDAGRDYYRAVAEGLARIGIANDSLLMGRGSKRSVTVSMSPSLAVRWLAPRLARFTARHPDIEVRVHASNSMLDTRWEGVDMALRYGVAGWPGVRAELLGSESLQPVLSPAMASGRSKSLSSLHELPALADNIPGGWPLWLRTVGLNPGRMRFRARFDDGAALLAAAQTGVGVALGRSRLVEDAVTQGHLLTPWTQCVAAPFSYWLVHPHAAGQSAAATTFATWVREEFIAQSAGEHMHVLPGATMCSAAA